MGVFSFFSKQNKQKKEDLNQSLRKTKKSLFSKIARAFIGKTSVDDEVLDNLEEVLISSDVGVDTTLKIIDRIEKRVTKEKIIGAEELNKFLRSEIAELLASRGLNIKETENLEDGISEVDIIYVTRVQEERFKDKNDANKYRGLLSLNQSIYTANCEPNTVIMHPLPRDSRSDANELDSDLYENPNLAIFRQADNGVVIRMAIFALVLDIEEKIEETSRPVNWKVGLKD